MSPKLILVFLASSLAFAQNVCPKYNTRCHNGCVPSDMGAYNAVCCSDDNTTACPASFECIRDGKCRADPNIITDPLVQVLPRYQLDYVTSEQLTARLFSYGHSSNLAYYSSHGDLQSMTLEYTQFDMVLIIIHGANRNADDYFTTALSLVKIQQQHQQQNVLVIAPWFPLDTDDNVPDAALVWSPDGQGGPWRYGASGYTKGSDNNNNNSTSITSSFAAVDVMIEFLSKRDIQRVTLAGHSAGGQFAQRWALLHPHINLNLRVLVANPSSYAYLTPLRYNGTAWSVPSAAADCPDYDSWEWGIHGYYHSSKQQIESRSSTIKIPPYVKETLDSMSYTSLVSRFLSRTVYYLAGSLDVCNIPDSDVSNAWCQSHGLETTCMDNLQGRNRWERNLRYYKHITSLATRDNKSNPTAISQHNRVVVYGVGHDHSLMFHRPEALECMFGNFINNGDKDMFTYTDLLIGRIKLN